MDPSKWPMQRLSGSEFVNDISQLWANDTPRSRFIREFTSRLKAHRPVDEQEEDVLVDSIDRLFNLSNYPFTALELAPSLTDEQVGDIFVRINSMGKSLVQADFILTLMSIHWDDGRWQLEDFCRSSKTPSTSGPSPFNYFYDPSPDELLRVAVGLGFKRAVLKHIYSILRGKNLETGEFSSERRESQFAILKEAQAYVLNLQNWHDFFKAIVRAGYRRSSLISSKMTIAYTYVFYLIGKRDYGVGEFELRDLIARWFFMASTTGRYTGNPETTMEQDLARLRDVKDGKEFLAIMDRIVNETFTEDYWNITLPNELERSSTRSPALFAYYAALNLLDAHVLFSKVKVAELMDPASVANKAPMETHHLFPKGYLKKIGISDQKAINQIGNAALLEWMDNIEITDIAPSEYYPRYKARMNDEELRMMLYWHALPDEWYSMSYDAFLSERRIRMSRVIKDGFSKLRAP